MLHQRHAHLPTPTPLSAFSTWLHRVGLLHCGMSHYCKATHGPSLQSVMDGISTSANTPLMPSVCWPRRSAYIWVHAPVGLTQCRAMHADTLGGRACHIVIIYSALLFTSCTSCGWVCMPQTQVGGRVCVPHTQVGGRACGQQTELGRRVRRQQTQVGGCMSGHACHTHRYVTIMQHTQVGGCLNEHVCHTHRRVGDNDVPKHEHHKVVDPENRQ